MQSATQPTIMKTQLLLSTLVLAIAASGCAHENIIHYCEDFSDTHVTFTANRSSIELGNSQEGVITLDHKIYCPTYTSESVHLITTPPYNGVTTSFSVNPMPSNATTGVSSGTLTIRNDGAAPGEYPITVTAAIGNYLQPVAGNYKLTTLIITLTVPDPLAGGDIPCPPWNQVTGISATNFSDIHFPRYQTTGYLTAGITPATDMLLKSTDAGRTWSLMPGTPDDPDGYIERVCFMDETNGFISVLGALNNTLYRTRNGGTAWEPVTSYTGGSIRSMIHSGYFYILPRFGDRIWVSVNKGETWTQPVVEPDAVVNDIELVTVTRLVAARGANGTGGISYSDDAGLTWQPSEAPNKVFKWVDFYDTENGIAGGEGVLALTSDGGMTWRQTGSFNSTRGSALLYLQPNIGDKRLAYAVSAADILETRDYGATWQRVCTATTPTALFDVETLYNGAAVVISRSVMYRRDP
jgi:photosystem II stability/assembly factor-like uncharacterized protein